MKIDNSWEVPDGFAPVLNYRNGNEGETVVGMARLPAADSTRQLEFWVGEDRSTVPALPLRDCGALWHSGWDIPTRYAIDGKGAAWKDNAHGGPLILVPAERLATSPETEEERRRIQKILGIPLERPGWVLAALSHGWTPPAGWADPE